MRCPFSQDLPEVPAPEALADMRQRLGDLIHDGGEDPVAEKTVWVSKAKIQWKFRKTWENGAFMRFFRGLNGVFMRFLQLISWTTCES